MPDYKHIADYVTSTGNRERIKHDFDLYEVYNGSLYSKVLEAIYQEFKDAKTRCELQNRIAPINFVKKITDTLAKVYLNEPIRTPVVEDLGDQELIELYSKSWNVNVFMDLANKFFKLTKHCLISPYVDKGGIPRLRAIPSHNFTLLSDDPINPERMTAVVIHLHEDKTDVNKTRFAYWDKDVHVILNGKGEVVREEMIAMNNEEMVNPFGVIPFVHINQQRDALIPIPASDIMAIQKDVCLLLSDSVLAQKYLSWGTLVISGSQDGDSDIKINPGSIINLPINADGSKPDAKYIQPKLNSDEVLRLVQQLIELLLTTNNISAGSVIGGMSAQNIASGVAKMLDKIDTTEDREDQQKYFIEAEQKVWDIYAHNMLPYWVETGAVGVEFAGAFSPDFEVQVTFPSIKPTLSNKEAVEIVKMKLDSGLMSMFDAVQELYPEMEEAQVAQWIANINKENKEKFQSFGAEFGQQITEVEA